MFAVLFDIHRAERSQFFRCDDHGRIDESAVRGDYPHYIAGLRARKMMRVGELAAEIQRAEKRKYIAQGQSGAAKLTGKRKARLWVQQLRGTKAADMGRREEKNPLHPFVDLPPWLKFAGRHDKHLTIS